MRLIGGLRCHWLDACMRLRFMYRRRPLHGLHRMRRLLLRQLFLQLRAVLCSLRLRLRRLVILRRWGLVIYLVIGFGFVVAIFGQQRLVSVDCIDPASAVRRMHWGCILHDRMFPTSGSVGRMGAVGGELVDGIWRVLIDGSDGMLLLGGGGRGGMLLLVLLEGALWHGAVICMGGAWWIVVRVHHRCGRMVVVATGRRPKVGQRGSSNVPVVRRRRWLATID